MTTMPERYTAARRALAAAQKVDEVKSMRDKAKAMEVYAMQAKDSELIALATDIRMRAERRIGELMEAERKAGTLAKGVIGRDKKGQTRGSRGVPRVIEPPTLADRGIDKHLADRARKAAALPEAKFEARVAKASKLAVAATENDKAVVAAAREAAQAEKKERRSERERELGAKIVALPVKRYGVILADPPWRFQPYSLDTGMDRAADNHYPTMTLDALKALAVPAADDCVLFLWATAPMLPEALELMRVWGFAYRSHAVWVKDLMGTGYWFRNQHEPLLVGVRGNIPAPAQGDQFSSVIGAPRGEHSAKPFRVHEIIETMFPTLPRLEMFARERFAGWDAWGNEAGSAEAAE